MEYFNFEHLYNLKRHVKNQEYHSIAMGIRCREATSPKGETCFEIQWVKNTHSHDWAKRIFAKIVSVKGTGFVKAIECDSNEIFEFDPLTPDNIETMLTKVSGLEDIIDENESFAKIENWFKSQFMPSSWTVIFPDENTGVSNPPKEVPANT